MVDLALVESANWPGDGVMYVTVCFVAAHDDLLKYRYVVEYGAAKQLQTAEIDNSMPTLAMEMQEKPAQDGLAVPVGTLMVKVRKHPEIYYYWYFLPIAAIILILLYRRFKYFRS